MKIEFYKYHGTGNDFIMINNLPGEVKLNSEQIQKLCNRHFGIGSDGLILVESSEEAGYHMNFYNPDGSQSLCGNGARCTFQFVLDQKLLSEPNNFSAIDGIHKVKKEGHLVSVEMKDVDEFELTDVYYFINTGSPHYIEYTEKVDLIDLIDAARTIRYSDKYKEEGTNVNYVQEISPNEVKMRTYERGVEDETLSCGTGVTAVALSMLLKNPGAESIDIQTSGGMLNVKASYIKNKFKNIWLKGPAQMVYKGEVDI